MKEIPVRVPRTLDEALDLLAAADPGMVIVSGGTDVIVQVLEGRKDPSSLLDVSRLPELRGIREEGGIVLIGALVTHGELERSGVIRGSAPLLAEGCFWVGSPQIKNLGTIGGNVVNASPVADSAPPLYALDAVLTLVSREGGARRVPIREFSTGPGKNALGRGELLIEISFRKPPAGSVSFYERLGQRRLLSISKVGTAFVASVRDGIFRDVAIALGAVAPTVIMAPLTAAFLEGKSRSPEVAAEAARILSGEARAITDLRSTKEYRNLMAGALLVRGLARVSSATPCSSA